MASKVRVRFAPSPTGYLHVGGARTALYNFLFAKKMNGTFILRIEDTDEERSTEESLRMQLADLQWLGLEWDEGPDPKTLKAQGDLGPYRQSERKDIYLKYANQLLESGKAFYCFLTDSEIEKQREELKASGKPLQMNSPYRDQSLEDAQEKIKNGEKAVVRFRVPDVRANFHLKDIVRGDVTWPSEVISDFVIVRAGGMPVYNFVCAIDDALMKITHVFRADDHLNNTVKQLLILEALGLEIPEYGHLSLILGEDKQKLSKRHGSTSCKEFRDRGVLPEALNNFIALLGWSDPEGREVLSIQQMQESFSSDRFTPSPAVFDDKKLVWMNSMHLRALESHDLWARIEPYLQAANLSFVGNDNWKNQVLETFKSYMETLTDAVDLFRPLDDSQFSIQDEAKETLSWDSSQLVIEKWQSLLTAHSGEILSEEEFLTLQKTVQKECEVKGKHLFMPIRVAIIGKPHGAELKILVPLMKKQTLIDRAQKALDQITS